ncbi:MAG: helix-turn-helix domain-containing protein [Planctomycetota bacterium]
MVCDRNINVHVTMLRRKLGKAPNTIQTVRGVGCESDADRSG